MEIFALVVGLVAVAGVVFNYMRVTEQQRTIDSLNARTNMLYDKLARVETQAAGGSRASTSEN